MRSKVLATVIMLASLGACGPASEVPAGGPSEQADTSPASTVPDAAVTLRAPAGVYMLDNTHAVLLGSIRHLGLSDYTIRFTRFDAEVTLDPEDLARSSVTLTLDPTSVSSNYPGDYLARHANTGFQTWDEQLGLDDGILAGRKHPEVKFVSSSVVQTGADAANVTGDLTLRGVTQPITLAVRFVGELEAHPLQKRPAIGFSAEGSFPATLFGLPSFGGALGDQVNVRFGGEFVQKAPPDAQ